MTGGQTAPTLASVLENPPQHDSHVPRASLVLPRSGKAPAIWMGGAHTPRGEAVDAASAADAVLVDCAGDLPAELRAAARRFQPCVFLDIDETPPSWPRIR